jgi:hypothetical protein
MPLRDSIHYVPRYCLCRFTHNSVYKNSRVRISDAIWDSIMTSIYYPVESNAFIHDTKIFSL